MPGHLEVNVSSLPVDDIFRTGCSDVVALDVRSRLLALVITVCVLFSTAEHAP